jgi:cytochrome c-type biogenesis protein CcmF
MLVFTLMAVLTMAGTSAPLLSALFTGTAGNVQTGYYNSVNGPLGLLVCLLCAVGPLVRWRQEAPGALLRQATPSLALGAVAAGVAFAFGMRSPVGLALVFGALFSLGANLSVTIKAARRGLPYAAGYVSHLGLAILLVGVLSYSTFGRDQQVALPQGKTVDVLGFKMRYEGKVPQPDKKDRVAVLVEGEGRSFKALPVIYFSEFNQSVMRNPHVERFWSHDVYISPIELKTAADQSGATLAKGESGVAAGVPLAFEDFERVGTMGDAKGFTIKARVKVGSGPDAAVVTPAIAVGPYGLNRIPADLPGGGSITLANVDPNSGTAQFEIVPAGGAAAGTPEVLAVEVSTKPLIGLVWVGMGMLLFGAALGIRRRLALHAEARVPAVPAGARVAAAR